MAESNQACCAEACDAEAETCGIEAYGADGETCGTDSCSTAFDDSIYGVSFEQAKESYGSRSFWVSFFVRPCCPPPGARQASKQLEEQRQMVRAREDFTDEQKAELIALIDEGESWYRSTPYWHKG